MGLARQKSHPSQRAGLLRRVFKRDGRHVCGLCRESYRGERDALSCLERCWQDVLAMDPVVPERLGPALRYRCRFCARDYRGRGQAARCASDCRDRMRARHAEELAVILADGDLPPPPKRSQRVRAMLTMAAARVVPKVTRREEGADSAAEGSNTVTADVRSAPAEPKPQPSVQVPVDAPAGEGGDSPPAEPVLKPKTQEVFYRDGAEYVCKVCEQRFFTRVEVTKCWEAHPD